MTTPSVLAVNALSSPRLSMITGSDITQHLGATFGTAEPANTGKSGAAINRALMVPNASDFTSSICIFQHNHIWHFDGTTVTSVYTLSPTMSSGSEHVHTGIHVVDIDGVKTYIAAYSDTTNYYGLLSTDGLSWTNTGILSGATAAVDGMAAAVVYQNVLFWVPLGLSGASSHQWNPTGTVVVNVANAGTYTGLDTGRAQCVFQNKLYQIAPAVSTAYYRLFEYQVSSWADLGLIAGSIAAASLSVIPLLFDGLDGNLVALVSNGGTGWKASAMAISMGVMTPTDVTATVLTPGIFASDSSTNTQFAFIVENETPTTKTGVLWMATTKDGSSNWAGYTWVDTSTAVVLIAGAGFPSNYYLPSTSAGCGERQWTPSRPTAEIVARVNDAGREQLTVIVTTFDGTGTKSFKIYYSLDGTIPNTLCTLSNPSHGSLHAGNQQIDGMPGDGSTACTLYWEATTDGVSDLSDVALMVEAI